MKQNTRIALGLLILCLLAGPGLAAMTEGKPEFKSMGPLAFGPDGILFVADARSAAIVAIDTKDTQPGAEGKVLKVEGINQKIAAMLGTTPDQILINDMAVNPISRSAYLAVSRGRGPDAAAVLMKVTPEGVISQVAMDKVMFSRTELPQPPADAQSGRSNPRMESITDIAYLNNKVIVAGLSNEEFASTFRTVPFPFATVENPTSIEMYHGAHGRYETRAPVRTFVSYTVGEEAALLAAYTCTPLVQVPMSDLKPGAKVRGKTIAEFGAGNRPLDMIVYQKDNKQFLLLSNSNHGVMKVSTDKIDQAASITDKVDGTQGLSFEKIQSWTGINQLDRVDERYAMVVRTSGDSMTLESLPLP